MKKKPHYKKLIGIILILTTILMTSCGSSISMPNDYNYSDLSKYIKLANYKGIKYTPADTSVSQEEIDAYIDEIIKNSASETKKITQGVAEENLTANITYIGKINGKKYEGGSANNVDLDLSKDAFLQGFSEQVIGHSVGETFEVHITYPKDYNNDKLAGKSAVFNTTLNYLTEKIYPEYNLEFVKKVSDCKSIAEYEKNIKKQIKANKETMAPLQDMETVFNTIVENSEVIEYPAKEYKSRIETLLSKDKTKEAVKRELVIHAIAEREGIEFVKSEYKTYAENYLTQNEITEENLAANGMSMEDYIEESQETLFSNYIFEKVMTEVIKFSIKK